MVNEWRAELGSVLESKVYEFKSMGYEEVTADDIWQCLNRKVWTEHPCQKRLHEVVQDIFHLASSTYMSYLTVSAFEEDDLMASIAALS
nr:post-transcriptional regulator [Lentibacillus saliphilus]